MTTVPAYNPATGAPLYDPTTGKPTWNCPSGTPGEACAECSDSVPANLEITFTGVTMCTDCVPYDGDPFDSSGKILSGSLDGTYALHQSTAEDPTGANPCIWVGTAAISMAHWFNSLTCGFDPPTVTSDGTAFITVTKTTTGWVIEVYGDYDVFRHVSLFHAEPTGTTCSSSLPTNVPNDNAACSWEGPRILGIDGTATVALP